MDRSGARPDEVPFKVEPGTSTKRIKLAPLLIILAIIILSFGCMILFWNITALTLSYPNAEVKNFDPKISVSDCYANHGLELWWASTIKFLSTDDVAQVELWYQKQGWIDYLVKDYNGTKMGGIGFGWDWRILKTQGFKRVFLVPAGNSTEIDIQSIIDICLFGN